VEAQMFKYNLVGGHRKDQTLEVADRHGIEDDQQVTDCISQEESEGDNRLRSCFNRKLVRTESQWNYWPLQELR
jgi:hypothetical protein